MTALELVFPVLGTTLPTDHAYALYSALSRVVPAVHSDADSLRIGPIPGRYAGNGLLYLESGRSRLRFRLPAEGIPGVLPLTGKMLLLANHAIQIGVPQVRALAPECALVARIVTIKDFIDPDPFLEAVQRQMGALGLMARASIPTIPCGPRQGQPRRRVLRIKDRRVVGYALHVTGLAPEDSIKLQTQGLGGRGKMGAGFFVALRKTEAE